jgi:hypothetical protein
MVVAVNFTAIIDIIDMPKTNTARNAKTVPMPTSMSPIP